MCNANDFVVENGVLTKYVGPGGDVVIPDGVAAIGERTFYKNKGVNSITMPASVTKLSKECFWGCRNLHSLELSENITDIEAGVFSYCVNLRRLHIPDTVVMNSFDLAINNCWNLCELILPAGITLNSERYGDCLELFNCCVYLLVCPGIPLNRIEDKKVYAAARGFAKYWDRFHNKEIADSYICYIRKRRKMFLAEFLENDMVSGLQLLADIGMITSANFESDYFQPANSSGAKLCVAFLLEWKSKNLSEKNVLNQQLRELTKDPYNVTDMKKIWSYEKNTDGTLILTSYKGKEEEVVIPYRIGANRVVKLGDAIFSGKKFSSWQRAQERKESLKNIRAIHVPDGVNEIGKNAFEDCVCLEKLILPESLEHINKDIYWKYRCKNVTIHAPEGSYAEAYAKENGISFVAL